MWVPVGLSLPRHPNVAIVDSSNVSKHRGGRAVGQAAEPVVCDVLMCSGLLRSVDTQALRGATNAVGRLIDVNGTPLDVATPPLQRDDAGDNAGDDAGDDAGDGAGHDAWPRRLATMSATIAEHGLPVSRSETGQPCVGRGILARNRLMAALADGAVIVEES